MQTRGKLFDDLASLATSAAGLANGLREEVETLVRQQMERMLEGMDLVTREEFDAMAEMARNAREENADLEARIAALEAAAKSAAAEA